MRNIDGGDKTKIKTKFLYVCRENQPKLIKTINPSGIDPRERACVFGSRPITKFRIKYIYIIHTTQCTKWGGGGVEIQMYNKRPYYIYIWA